MSRFLRNWISINPWTDVYGLARSLLALGSLLTFAFNAPHFLFPATVGLPTGTLCRGPYDIGLFCVVPVSVAQWIAVGILTLVVIGWRPRWTALFHFWVTMSFVMSARIQDGGDQVAAVLSFLLLPVALTDSRQWHWFVENEKPESLTEEIRRLGALFALTAIRIQVGILYLDAAVSKFHVQEWVDGTVLYYWLSDPNFGLNTILKPLFWPIITSPAVAILTWGSLAMEVLLAYGLLAGLKWRGPLLVSGILFHAGIALMMGLTSFGFSMFAALVLYLRPCEQSFQLASKYARSREWKPVPKEVAI